MDSIQIIEKYFPKLTAEQKSQFEAMGALYAEWNAKINVISRKDMDAFMEHHVLHSLAIAKFMNIPDGAEVLDLGTGGGFPAIPLAVFYPNINIHAIDGTGKKIMVLNEVASALGLKNIRGEHIRAEDCWGQYDYVVSRAVMPMPDLVRLARPLVKKKNNFALPPGVISLKGGDLDAELRPFYNIVEVENLSDYFEEEYFKSKMVIYVPSL